MGAAAPHSTLPMHPACSTDMAARHWEATRASPFLLAWILRHLFVCLSLGNQERMERKKKINITLSPMSHCSQLLKCPILPPRCWGSLEERGEKPEVPHGHQHYPQTCAPSSSWCPQAGTLAGGPGVKAGKEFAFIFAFPNCTSGFPGTAAGFGFHGRFCAG